MKQWHDNLDDERVEMIFNTFLLIVGLIGAIAGSLISYFYYNV